MSDITIVIPYKRSRDYASNLSIKYERGKGEIGLSTLYLVSCLGIRLNSQLHPKDQPQIIHHILAILWVDLSRQICLGFHRTLVNGYL
jgi:hypothetical protein